MVAVPAATLVAEATHSWRSVFMLIALVYVVAVAVYSTFADSSRLSF